MSSKIAVILPTLNASSNWRQWLKALRQQTLVPDIVLILDSSSDDDTAKKAKAAGCEVVLVQRSRFNHGGTRQIAVDALVDVDLLVYLTQDAILAEPESLERIVAAFGNSEIGAAYGRQLPRPGAGPIESHARLFNYPADSHVRKLKDREWLGCKSIFFSNSFAVYRRDALNHIGGFPNSVIVGEDSYVAARMLLVGLSIAYVAEATVYHSHSYSYAGEFRRYFDMGAFHSREKWVLDEFGGTSGEGLRFVSSELASLWPRFFWLIPSALLRTALKFVGYRVGRAESKLSLRIKRRLSMHSGFWMYSGPEPES